MNLHTLLNDEAIRNEAFPVSKSTIYLGHAGVSPLPKAACDAIVEYARRGATENQEGDWTPPLVAEARQVAADLVECSPDEIALLGPTSLGLSLIANGLEWSPGDEVVCYLDDYPANAYPWMNLTAKGVKVVLLHPEKPGLIDWPLVESALTDRTKLVALASCNYLSGYRIPIDEIGRELQSRGILFSLDGIQTIGAFPTRMEYVDFMSADSHKWMLGPAAAGIVYVKKSRFEMVRPTLLGAWNVDSPEFVTQEEMRFHPTARRYEPGMMNLPGILGMAASLCLIRDMGLDAISEQLLKLRAGLLEQVRPAGYRLYLEDAETGNPDLASYASSIITLFHPKKEMREVFARLEAAGMRASLRMNRAGDALLRVSPHFYNTETEMERVAEILCKP